MASPLRLFPQWQRHWPEVQTAAARWGVSPNELLALLAFENSNADRDAVSSANAVGLAQIADASVRRDLNPRQYDKFMAMFGELSDGRKRNPRYSINYAAWRMAGTRSQYGSLDEWYRSPGYNPGFRGDSRGPGPSIYVANNKTSHTSTFTQGIPFPVAGGGTYTSTFGDPRDGGQRKHKGVDIAADRGTPLIAVADGKVALRTGGAGGNAIWINGTYYYAHLQSFNVKDGQTVRKGDVIGFVGNTGTSTGPHLHFQYDPTGKFGAGSVDPMPFLEGTVSADDIAVTPDDVLPFDNPLDSFFAPNDSPLPHRVGPPQTGPEFPGFGGAESFRRRDHAATWQIIANQEFASPEAQRFAGMFGEEA